MLLESMCGDISIDGFPLTSAKKQRGCKKGGKSTRSNKSMLSLKESLDVLKNQANLEASFAMSNQSFISGVSRTATDFALNRTIADQYENVECVKIEVDSPNQGTDVGMFERMRQTLFGQAVEISEYQANHE